MEGTKKRITTETSGDVTIVNFTDRKILDDNNIQEIGEELFDLVDKHYKIKLLLDFDNVEYLSSAALGKLITLNKKVAEEDGDLKLCGIRPQIYEVFKITKLNKLFDIYEEQDRALKRFKS